MAKRRKSDPKRGIPPELQKFAARVIALRNKTGLSQEAFADAAGIDRSYMSGIERGMRNIGILTLHKLAKALHKPIGALFDAD